MLSSVPPTQNPPGTTPPAPQSFHRKSTDRQASVHSYQRQRAPLCSSLRKDSLSAWEPETGCMRPKHQRGPLDTNKLHLQVATRCLCWRPFPMPVVLVGDLTEWGSTGRLVGEANGAAVDGAAEAATAEAAVAPVLLRKGEPVVQTLEPTPSAPAAAPRAGVRYALQPEESLPQPQREEELQHDKAVAVRLGICWHGKLDRAARVGIACWNWHRED
mmetsp:Transcript_36141/g.90915  ORF Transcript_36141/g.90915 Transcript_36141/m.90915 type:complete len:216 (-) Transcript_36141:389-1036(-)